MLVIDDNRAIHDDFRKILSPSTAAAALDATETALFGDPAVAVQQVQFVIASAYQGQEGAELVKQAIEEGLPFSMAFVDVRMPPGWDGVETTRKLWELDPDLQVVLCTAYSDYSWGEMFEKLGHRDGLLILKKPFDAVEALQIAHALTEKWALHQQSRRRMEELESRVADRTGELQQANRALQTEVVEHRRSEATLRDSEEKFRQMADNITDVFWVDAPDMETVHYVSPAYEQVWGRSVKDLYANPQEWNDAIFPEDRGRVSAEFSRLALDAPSVSAEYRISRPDGTVRWILSRGFQVRDAAGKLTRLTGIASDITERKQAEIALQESEARTRLLVKSSSIGLWDWNLVTDEVFFSPEWKEQLGYTDAELPSRLDEWESRLHPEDREPTLALVKDYLEGRRADYDVEFRMRHKDGSWRWIFTRASMTRDASGKPVRLMGGHIDVTDRKLAAEALRESNDKFNQLADNITDTFWIRSPDLGKLYYVSPAFERIWGRTVESLYANPQAWTDFILPEDRERVRAAFAALTKDAPTLDIEYQIARPDGTVRWIQSRGFQVRDAAGKLTRLAGIVSDITERKQGEAAIQRSRKRLRDLIDGVGPSMFVGLMTPQGILVESNRPALEAAGLKPEDVLGKPFAETYWWAYSPDIQERLRAAIAKAALGEASRYDAKVRGADGQLIDIDFSLQPLRDDTGEVVFIVPSASVITERKQAEIALQERVRLAALEADVGTALTRGGTLADMLRLCSEAIVRRLDAAFARIWILNDQEGMLELVASAGMYTHLDGPHSRVPVGKFKIGLIAAERLPHMTNQVVGDSLVGDQEWAEREGMAAFAGYPLIVHDRLVGVVAMFARQAVSETTLLALASVANNIALGIENKRAEAALQTSEARTKAIVQSSLDCVVTIDHDGRILEFNPAAELVFGLPGAAVLGLELAEVIIPPALRDKHRQGLMRYLATGETRVLGKRIEILAMNSDGKEFPVELAITRLGAEEPPLFTGFIRDISERKRAERQLAIQHAISRVLAESSTAEEATPRMLQVVCETFGWDVSELWSLDSREGVLRCADIWSATDTTLDEFKAASRQMTFARDVGLPGRVWGSGQPAWIDDVVQDGNFPRALAAKHVGLRSAFAFPIVIGSDVSGVIECFSREAREPDQDLLRTFTVLGSQLGQFFQRRRLEDQLFQSQKLETVGKLAGGIAHEFNSILTAIIGQSELMLGDLPAGSPLVNNATEISKAAGRAATLTRQLLAYGSKQFLQPETIDLNRVIASMTGIFDHLMGGKIVTHVVPAPGLQAVKADAGQLEQVIMNLAINARDAMPNGGQLTLETANISLDQDSVGRYPELKPGHYVRLAISDTGAGMSAEVQAHIFEPFFTTKGVGDGSGLGLSTCYGIVKQSGGHISVYSEPGRGTTFKIYLPQAGQQPKTAVLRLDSPGLPRGTETILLVEDDPALCEMAATLLRRLGYRVLSAANGIEALSLKQRLETGHVDLLFTDVVLPHMSGTELADRVRASNPHTRILFTSAYTENAIVHQGVLTKGVALLQKPFTPSALARKIRDVLDEPGALGPDHGGAERVDERSTSR